MVGKMSSENLGDKFSAFIKLKAAGLKDADVPVVKWILEQQHDPAFDFDRIEKIEYNATHLDVYLKGRAWSKALSLSYIDNVRNSSVYIGENAMIKKPDEE